MNVPEISSVAQAALEHADAGQVERVRAARFGQLRVTAVRHPPCLVQVSPGRCNAAVKRKLHDVDPCSLEGAQVAAPDIGHRPACSGMHQH
jgi:hypothetical protein